MTREEIIDKYGFNPTNYAEVYNFLFCHTLVGQNKIKFVRSYCGKTGCELKKSIDDFHKGRFYNSFLCDVSYLSHKSDYILNFSEGEYPKNDVVGTPYSHLLIHIPSKKYIVVSRTSFYLYFRPFINSVHSYFEIGTNVNYVD